MVPSLPLYSRLGFALLWLCNEGALDIAPPRSNREMKYPVDMGELPCSFEWFLSLQCLRGHLWARLGTLALP